MDLQQNQQIQGDQQISQQEAPYSAFPKKSGKMIYIIIGILLALLIAAGLYWYFGRPAIAPMENLGAEDEALNQDLAELELMTEDKSLDSLDFDLTRAAGEQVVIKTVSVEALATEMSNELNSLSADLTGLESVSVDTSLDNLESGLMNASQ